MKILTKGNTLAIICLIIGFGLGIVVHPYIFDRERAEEPAKTTSAESEQRKELTMQDIEGVWYGDDIDGGSGFLEVFADGIYSGSIIFYDVDKKQQYYTKRNLNVDSGDKENLWLTTDEGEAMVFNKIGQNQFQLTIENVEIIDINKSTKSALQQRVYPSNSYKNYVWIR